MSARAWGLGLALAGLSACAASRFNRRNEAAHASTHHQQGGPDTDLPTRESLPAHVREALYARMGRHGEQLTSLLTDVVLLDFESAAQLAQEIAQEPPLARPALGDTSSLNALLPATFFDHQDELRARSQRLSRAARARDRAELVAAFGSLAESCVGCHAAYLEDELPAHATEP